MALKENLARPFILSSPDKNSFERTTGPQQIDYEDDRIERLIEITNNLENFYNENPDLFKNEEEFKKNFHFDERSPLQQGVLQGFFNKKTNPTEPTPSADANEDIFGDTAGEATSEDKGTERDALVGGGSKVEEPKATDLSSEADNVKKDMAKRELEEADKNIKEGKQYATPAPKREEKAKESKPARKNFREALGL